MITKARINKAITHTGLRVWGNGDGYFYFLNAAESQVGRCVYVCRLNHLPLAEWVRAAEEASRSRIIDGIEEPDYDALSERYGF